MRLSLLLVGSLLVTPEIYSKAQVELQNGIDNIEIDINLEKTFLGFINVDYRHYSFYYYKTRSQPLLHKYTPSLNLIYRGIGLGYLHVSGGTGIPSNVTNSFDELNDGYDQFIDFLQFKFHGLTFFYPVRTSSHTVYLANKTGVGKLYALSIKYYNVLEYADTYKIYDNLMLYVKFGVNQIPELNTKIKLYYYNLFVGFMSERTHYLHVYNKKIRNVNLGVRFVF